MKYYYWLFFYITASVLSQFLTSTPLHLFDIGSINIWMPLSALTVVPLVDVLRCFTQHQAENERRKPKTVMLQMMILSLLAALLCVIFAGLPLPIFVGVLAAIASGNVVDFFTFRFMRRFTQHPVLRMAGSNLITTLVGSGLVFLIAFTDLFFKSNPLAQTTGAAITGWLSQSFFIWVSGIAIAFTLNKLRGKNA